MNESQLQYSDLNIEIAHVEFTEKYELAPVQDLDEAKRSAALAAQLCAFLDSQGLSYTVSILIDNKRYISSERENRDYTSLNNEHIGLLIQAVRTDIDIDYICDEGSLRLYFPQLHSALRLNKKTRKYLSNAGERLENEGVLPCDADIVIWHLMRLGYFERSVVKSKPQIIPVGLVKKENVPPFFASKAISILHEHHREPEELARRRYLCNLQNGNQHFAERVGRIYFNETTYELADAGFDFDLKAWLVQLEQQNKGA